MTELEAMAIKATRFLGGDPGETYAVLSFNSRSEAAKFLNLVNLLQLEQTAPELVEEYTRLKAEADSAAHLLRAVRAKLPAGVVSAIENRIHK